LVVPVASSFVVSAVAVFVSDPAYVSGLICAPKFHVDGVTAAAPLDGRYTRVGI
jgi:hypothetical protein